jgi:hypothetical protein
MFGLFGAPYPEIGKPLEEASTVSAPAVISSATDDGRSRFG